uniref:non-specific serine/threonine protein kinase n=1 Tax=Sinocyclocheilus anshuiensis TaxID=1608454 RepID=A0A671LM09_9TELE
MARVSSSLIANRYIIQQTLGKGSFGTVYLVKDTKAGAAERLLYNFFNKNVEITTLTKINHGFIILKLLNFLLHLDCKLEELKRTSRTLSEPQVCEWLCQLLLRILHRDLKAKNIFLRKNIVKIGDFGVSCLLIGSCDLATSFTGTPYYMSPEALSHRGYDSKSDIWSLGCILNEMCCLAQNFLAVVMRIVEGPTPSLPETYSRQLNCLIMLEKDSSRRISAANALRSRFIEESLQVRRHLLEPHRQKKVHLHTLRERSEVQKISPREHMRLRKLQAADEKARKLKQIVEEKYQENHLRMQEYKSKNFQKVSVDVLVIMIEATCRIKTLLNNSEYWLNLCYFSIVSAIPEDPQVAEAFYSVDEFESCSEEDSDGEEDSPKTLLIRHLGEDMFLKVYDYLKQARQRQESEENIKQTLIQLVERPGDCFEVDQLLYYEELFLAAQENIVR